LKAWNGAVAVAVESSAGSAKRCPEPLSLELTAKGAQLVGLTVKFGRLM
jgi:hypothetical protein